jgi:hypothetical protein
VATAGGAEEPAVPPPSWRENIARLGRFSGASATGTNRFTRACTLRGRCIEVGLMRIWALQSHSWPPRNTSTN